MGVQKSNIAAPPGQLVDIGGFRLHAIVRGQGRPAVILEPGLGGFALQYRHIQEGVCAFTRVLAYDRAGQAWSDPSPAPRTPANLAGELTTLLERLALQPPYILVGHSFGGFLARIYAGLHPEAVAGLVLVDSSDVEMYEVFPDLDKMIRQAAIGVGLLKLAARLGLGKQLAKLSMGSAAKTLPVEDVETFAAVASQPKHQDAMLAEYAQHRCYWGPQSQVPRALGDLPVTIITAGNSVSGKGKMGRLTIAEINARHQRWQIDLLQLSSCSEQVVIPEATHLSLITQPEHAAQVVEAVRGMVERAR